MTESRTPINIMAVASALLGMIALARVPTTLLLILNIDLGMDEGTYVDGAVAVASMAAGFAGMSSGLNPAGRAKELALTGAGLGLIALVMILTVRFSLRG